MGLERQELLRSEVLRDFIDYVGPTGVTELIMNVKTNEFIMNNPVGPILNIKCKYNENKFLER